MSIKHTYIQLALALFLGIHLTKNNAAVAVTTSRQYSIHQPKSHYPQSSSSYGSDNQNDFSYGGEQGYPNPSEANPRQQFPLMSYGESGGGYDDIDDQYSRHQSSQQHDSFQPHASYHDHLDGTYRPEQDSLVDSYGRYYDSRQSDDGGRYTSSLLSFDSIDSNNSELGKYQTAEDVLYPPLDNQQNHQYQESTKQQNLHISDYMTDNKNMSPLPTTSRGNTLQSMSHQTGERTSYDNEASANAAAQILLPMNRPQTQPRTAHGDGNFPHSLNAKSYIEIENQHQHQQDQQHIPRTNEHQPQHATHFEAQFTNNSDILLSSSSPTRTYYVAADSDLSFSTSNHPTSSNPVSLLHSHLVKLPALSSPQVHQPAQQGSYVIPNEPIPISKHVEITKHVPVPVYRQVHVPFRKPVRIEIPRPVISTVPRPYPIQIPITKTVAVPLVKEVKIPIEKVTPYPVEHRVPYVVEKRVPFQVERQIAAPIYYPFPVRVPMVRTILHKKKAHLSPLHYHPRIHM